MFKSKLGFFAVAVAAVIMPLSAYSAEKKDNAPAETVKLFYTSMAKADFAAAKKCVAAEELQKLIALLETVAKENPDLKADTGEEFAPIAAGKFETVKISGDTATVTCTYIDKKKKKKKESHSLKKINNTWKITD